MKTAKKIRATGNDRGAKRAAATKQPAGTIDMTPTWEGLLPALIELAARGDKVANDELRRLATMGDHLRELNDPDKLRTAGIAAVALLEASPRGRTALDHVQRLMQRAGYGLDQPGLDAMVTIMRCCARSIFNGVVQCTEAERRVRKIPHMLPDDWALMVEALGELRSQVNNRICPDYETHDPEGHQAAVEQLEHIDRLLPVVDACVADSEVSL